MSRFSYTSGSRVLPLTVFGALAVFAAFLIVGAVTNASGPPLAFTALWIAAGVWNAYWWLWRISYRLEVDGGTLRWTTPLRSGEVPVTDVAEIAPAFFGQVTKLVAGGRESPMVLTRKGISEFATALLGDRPIPVTVRFVERTSGFGLRSAFRRED